MLNLCRWYCDIIYTVDYSYNLSYSEAHNNLAKRVLQIVLLHILDTSNGEERVQLDF